MGSTVSAVLSTAFKLQGVSYSISSACSTGAHCIGVGMEQIQLNKADISFCGAGEAEDWGFSVMFDSMGALSTKCATTPPDFSSAPPLLLLPRPLPSSSSLDLSPPHAPSPHRPSASSPHAPSAAPRLTLNPLPLPGTTMTRAPPRAPSTRHAMASSSRAAAASSSSRSSSTRRRAAPRSTRSSRATAPTRTATTWSRPRARVASAA